VSIFFRLPMADAHPTEADVAFVADLAAGHWKTAIVHALVRFDICDAIHSLAGEGPAGGVAASDIAAKSGTHPRTTYRLLRASSTLGLVEERSGERFLLTAKGKLLTTEHPVSMKHLVLVEAGDIHRRGWLAFDDVVATGQDVSAKVFGVSGYWQVLKENPAHADAFNKAMTAFSRADMATVVSLYDFSWAKTLVDVAGGQGQAAFTILEKHPDLHATVIDQPDVVAGAPDLIPEALRPRVTFRPFDLFDAASYPTGADLYLLKHILHDWDDDHCVTILRHIAAAMGPTSRIVVAEIGISPPNVPGFGKLVDLHMLTLVRGAERTEAELQKLADPAGLTVKEIASTPVIGVMELRRNPSACV